MNAPFLSFINCVITYENCTVSVPSLNISVNFLKLFIVGEVDGALDKFYQCDRMDCFTSG